MKAIAKSKRTPDTLFLGIVITLVVFGLFMFISAALSFYAKNPTQFWSVVLNQVVFGLIGGTIALLVGLKIPYLFWKKYALYFLIGAIVLTIGVFIPGIGFEHGGARRWISVGPVSFQPSEFLKVAFIFYFAAWLSWAKNKVESFSHGLIPLLILLGVTGGILLLQPDTDTFMIIAFTGLVMYFLAGARWKHIGIIFATGIIGILILLGTRDYLQQRVKTFLNPSLDPKGASWQIQQSMLAIGSGQIMGRGYGQSIQKFRYLPEPAGDSIFAVLGEEFGFIGTTLLVIAYLILLLRGLKIAKTAQDQFGGLLVSGIVIMLVSQSFLNIASSTGLFPLSGTPLVFISHGGTALLAALASIGIVLNVSKNERYNLKRKTV